MARVILHLCSLSSAKLLWALASSIQDSCDVTDASAACTAREVEDQEHVESAAARLEMLQVTSKQTLQAIHEHKGKRSDDDDNDIEVCHGCLLHSLCVDLGRIDCEKRAGIWHQEDPTTALVEGEIAEMKQLSALDTDGDGLITGAEVAQVLRAMGEKPTEDDILYLMSSIDQLQQPAAASQYATSKAKSSMLLDTNTTWLPAIPLIGSFFGAVAGAVKCFAIVGTVVATTGAVVGTAGVVIGTVAAAVAVGKFVMVGMEAVGEAVR